jgi:hypothetical protein
MRVGDALADDEPSSWGQHPGELLECGHVVGDLAERRDDEGPIEVPVSVGEPLPVALCGAYIAETVSDGSAHRLSELGPSKIEDVQAGH